MSGYKGSPMAKAFLTAVLCAGAWDIGTNIANHMLDRHAHAAEEAGAVYTVAALLTYKYESDKKRQMTH